MRLAAKRKKDSYYRAQFLPAAKQTVGQQKAICAVAAIDFSPPSITSFKKRQSST